MRIESMFNEINKVIGQKDEAIASLKSTIEDLNWQLKAYESLPVIGGQHNKNSKSVTIRIPETVTIKLGEPLRQTLHPTLKARPRNGVSIVLLRNDGLVWLSHRGLNCSYPGFLQCPGGGVEDGETLVQAASRELKEETGLDAVFGGQPDYISEHTCPDGLSTYKCHTFVLRISNNVVPEHTEKEKQSRWESFSTSAMLNRRDILMPSTLEFLEAQPGLFTRRGIDMSEINAELKK